MKLSDYQGEDAIDLLADLLDPMTEICQDKELQEKVKTEKNQLKLVQYLLKNHKKSIIKMMAMIDGQDPEDYKCNPFTLPIKLLEFMNDPEVIELFQSQGQMIKGALSGSVMENIGAEIK